LKHYIFYEGLPDSSCTFGFEPTLFNLYAHCLLQRSEGWVSFFALKQKNKNVVAVMHFNINDNAASSPFRSPFGSVDFYNAIQPKVLFEFIKFCEEALRERGINTITIKNPPSIFQGTYEPLLQTFLLNLGYEVIDAEVGAVVLTDNAALPSLNANEKRRLKQASLAGLAFKELPSNSLSLAYRFIAKCKSNKNYALSMTEDQISMSLTKFPDRFKFFAVYEQEELAAASIAIVVTKNILYNFYVDHSEKFNHLSPVVLLISGIYDYCKKNGIKFLDLGTSAVNGHPNFGLLDFKLNLGATPTSKLTFQKKLK
jgi:hypothetical protein